MPQRTNHFQRLVTLVHEHLSKDWVVTESEFLTHRLSGEEREVDIVLKNSVGIHDLIISIECTDRKRKAGSEWIEAMFCKHQFLETSKLILWSASAFYKPAIILAEKYGVELVSQEDPSLFEWAIFSKMLRNCRLKLVESRFTFFIDVKDSTEKKVRLEKSHDYLFKRKDGIETFTIKQLMHHIMHNEQLGTTLLDHATKEKTDFWVQFTPPWECVVFDENQISYEPFRIGFGVKAIVEETVPKTMSVKYDNKVATLAVAELEKKQLEFFITEEEPNSK